MIPEWLNNIPATLFVIGIALIILDVFLINVYILAFVGSGPAIVATFLYLANLQVSWPYAIFASAIVSLLVAAVLWKPFKKQQAKTPPKGQGSDQIGKRYTTTEKVTKAVCKIAIGDTSRQVKLHHSVEAGEISENTVVEVVGLDGIILIVKPVEQN
ncbi:MAG: NfeD family protein [Alphaproteobacteria bacterium]|nr:NfeD family protein [Alphaproteobacteria bacterium]MDD9920604.1 NfeD family protein [Alphaproteobacteria bacterium]